MNRNNDPAYLIRRLLKESTIDTRKLHDNAAEITKQKILGAAARRFATDGYHGATIDGIAREAGVTKGAVYHHFKDKKDLLMAANRSRQLRTQEIIRKGTAETSNVFEGLKIALGGEFRRLRGDARSKGMMREYLAMAMTDPDVNRMFRHEDTELLDILSTEFARCYPKLSSKRKRSIVQEIYVSLAGILMASVVDSAIGASPEQLLDALMDRFRKTVELEG